MKFSTETVGRLLASGRNYISTAVGFIGGVGIVSAANSKGLMDAINEIFNGLAMVFSGATSLWNVLLVAFPIIGGIMARFASKSATIDSQAASFKAASQDPNTPVSDKAKADMLVAVTETVPLTKPIEVNDKALAAAVPSSLVVAAK